MRMLRNVADQRSLYEIGILGISRCMCSRFNASDLSFSATLLYHPTISVSGWHGRLSLGSILGNNAPLIGFVSSKRLTASCKK